MSRVSSVLKAKTSVPAAARLSARTKARSSRAWGSIEPLVSQSTTSRGRSIRRARRARWTSSPPVARAARKLRRRSAAPRPRTGVRRRLGRVARRSASRARRRSIAASSAGEQRREVLPAEEGRRAVAGPVAGKLAGPVVGRRRPGDPRGPRRRAEAADAAGRVGAAAGPRRREVVHPAPLDPPPEVMEQRREEGLVAVADLERDAQPALHLGAVAEVDAG